MLLHVFPHHHHISLVFVITSILLLLTRPVQCRVAPCGPGSPSWHHQHPPYHPDVDNTQPEGESPLNVSNVERLGFQVANNSASYRDLGFTGKIAGKWYAVFGDTMWCAPGVSNFLEDTPGFHGMVRDSVSLLTDDPLTVVDLNLNDDCPVPHQNQLIPFNEEWGETNQFGFGGTSFCETDAENATAALYYLVVCFSSRTLFLRDPTVNNEKTERQRNRRPRGCRGRQS